MKFDFKDISLVPNKITNIYSREKINSRTSRNFLPIMAAPMDTVVNINNANEYVLNSIMPCLPRIGEGVPPRFNNDSMFVSMSLNDFSFFLNEYSSYKGHSGIIKILVDVANGHMSHLHGIIQKFIDLRREFGKINEHQIMVGNIANPETYEEYAKMGVDYVRVGIGGGSGCLTSANTGVHYPMASLIAECYVLKVENGYQARIVADGGFKNYDDIIKALALGADYVMLGGIFNQCIESCGDTKLFKYITIPNHIAKDIWYRAPFMRKFMYKSFRGMSTKEVQKSWGKTYLKTSEGIVKTNKINYSLSQWTENFESYLKSAMSYTDSTTLDEFKKSDYIFITQNALNRFDK